MLAAGRFDWLSEDEGIASCEQLETKTPKRKRCKNFWKRITKNRTAFNWGAKENPR